MKPLHTLLLALLLAQASGLSASEGEPWLQLTKTESGFLFEGVENGGRFSFGVPGTIIQTAKDGHKAFAMIDDVLVQVFRVEPPQGGDDTPLGNYADGESKFFESSGGKVSASDLCKSMGVDHQEWRGVMPNGATSVFFATRLGNKLLVVVVASDAALSERTLATMSAVCNSFKA